LLLLEAAALRSAGWAPLGEGISLLCVESLLSSSEEKPLVAGSTDELLVVILHHTST
jgi:hypothetical protein